MSSTDSNRGPRVIHQPDGLEAALLRFELGFQRRQSCLAKVPGSTRAAAFTPERRSPPEAPAAYDSDLFADNDVTRIHQTRGVLSLQRKAAIAGTTTRMVKACGSMLAKLGLVSRG